MVDRIVKILAASVLLLIIAEPAMAVAALPRVPEPATMSLFGLGVGGAFIVRKLIGRK
jgi:hypothetical protein